MSRYLAIALVLIAAGSAQAAEKRLDRTFTVAPGGALTVDADGASVHVSGGDGNQVVVHMLARGSEDNLANTQLEAVQNGNGVNVTLKKEKRGWFSWGNWNSDEEHRGDRAPPLRDQCSHRRRQRRTARYRGRRVIANLRRQRLGEERDRECRGANLGRLDPRRDDQG